MAHIAYDEMGKVAGWAAILAILFILVIALAGLGRVVVNALGGGRLVMPGGAVRVIPGSPWGTFTIACTIPIALFVGLYMYRIRSGRVVEASIIGGVLTLAATVFGGWVAEHQIGQWFNLSAKQVVWAMAIYGFVASVLPVWLLLTPRDYLSSFLKIGTILLLVIGTIVANPKMQAPMFNSVFAGGGPVVGSGSASVPGRIFPFLFITIMCGAISGFHSLVSSGTTPKMIRKESDARMIGYGAMLVEGLVGVVAMIAAATLAPGDYYAMNMDLAHAPAFHEKLTRIGADIDHLNVYDDYTKESLRGRTGGAVTLAVGMANIFQHAAGRFADSGGAAMRAMWKYWYHFAIMFEALFILTTIDAGTRIGRFLLQEIFGLVNPKFGRTDWWPGSILSTLLIVTGWAYFINANSFSAIWTMFGIANQMLAVIALAVVTTVLAREEAEVFVGDSGADGFRGDDNDDGSGGNVGGASNHSEHAVGEECADYGVVTSVLISAGLIVGMLICTYTIVGAGLRRVWGKGRSEDGAKERREIVPEVEGEGAF